MKTKQLKTILALMIAGTFSIFQAQAQTCGSNLQTNSLVPVAGSHTTCVCFGSGAGTNLKNQTASDNVAIGDSALFTQANPSGGSEHYTFNVAVGNKALLNTNPSLTTNGIKNTSIGANSLLTNSTGYNNCALGFEAGYTNTTGKNNTFLGYESGRTSSIYDYNTIVGWQAGYSNAATGTTLLGVNSGQVNTANYSTFLGYQAGNQNTSGSGNVCIGIDANYYNTTGSGNTVCGYEAGGVGYGANTIMFDNAIYGYLAGYKEGTTSGVSGDCFFGYEAGYSNTGSGANTFIGQVAGFSNTAGYSSGNTTGSNECFVGDGAGTACISGSNNTCIGEQANVCTACSTLTNVTAIGYQASVTAAHGSNTMQLGNTSITSVWCQPGVWNVSDRRIKNNIQANVPGLAFIKLLQPVTYHYDIHKQNNIQGYPTKTTVIHEVKDSLGHIVTPFSSVTSIDTAMWDGKYDIEKINYTGLIAQQVDSAAQQINYDFSGVHKPKDGTGIYGLNYAQFVVPLIKAVQELSKTVDSLKAANSSHRMMQNNGNGKNNIDTVQVKLALLDGATLGDAQPNPNSGSTQIPYYLPQNTTGAKIIFTDLLGKVMKEQALQAGYGLMNVDTQDLPGGIYNYSLIVDGKLIDNKKMIRSK